MDNTVIVDKEKVATLKKYLQDNCLITQLYYEMASAYWHLNDNDKQLYQTALILSLKKINLYEYDKISWKNSLAQEIATFFTSKLHNSYYRYLITIVHEYFLTIINNDKLPQLMTKIVSTLASKKSLRTIFYDMLDEPTKNAVKPILIAWAYSNYTHNIAQSLNGLNINNDIKYTIVAFQDKTQNEIPSLQQLCHDKMQAWTGKIIFPYLVLEQDMRFIDAKDIKIDNEMVRAINYAFNNNELSPLQQKLTLS